MQFHQKFTCSSNDKNEPTRNHILVNHYSVLTVVNFHRVLPRIKLVLPRIKLELPRYKLTFWRKKKDKKEKKQQHWPQYASVVPLRKNAIM